MSSIASTRERAGALKIEAPDKEEPLIKEYRIIQNNDLMEFTLAVNSLLKEGWRPQGGVCKSKGCYYLQAMVR